MPKGWIDANDPGKADRRRRDRGRDDRRMGAVVDQGEQRQHQACRQQPKLRRSRMFSPPSVALPGSQLARCCVSGDRLAKAGSCRSTAAVSQLQRVDADQVVGSRSRRPGRRVPGSPGYRRSFAVSILLSVERSISRTVRPLLPGSGMAKRLEQAPQKRRRTRLGSSMLCLGQELTIAGSCASPQVKATAWQAQCA